MNAGTNGTFPVELTNPQFVGALTKLNDDPILPGGTWYQCENELDAMVYEFDAGTLAGATHICFDLLVDGCEALVMQLHLDEGDSRSFWCHFSTLNQCQARVRLPIEALDQNCWCYPSEGSWIKPICAGDRVEAAKVTRLKLVCLRKGDGPVRFCQSNITFVDSPPELITKPLLPAGKLLDELGQSCLKDWPGKTPSRQQLNERLNAQLAEADTTQWPENFSRYGGWRELEFDASGFFRTHHDGRRWWLVDPDGYAFFSAGLDCVRPTIESNITNLRDALSWISEDETYAPALRKRKDCEIFDYLTANMISAFGIENAYENWGKIAISLLKQFGFNTVANWSDWHTAARAAVPYVRPLAWPAEGGPQVKRVFRDMPDVFDPEFKNEAAHYAKQLDETRDDPALIGYFLMNEPTWGFAEMTVAEGILINSDSCHCRDMMADVLKQKYTSDEKLSDAWGQKLSFDDIRRGKWTTNPTAAAQSDLEQLSSLIADKLFATLTQACRKVDPNHLNLGARYFRVPPKWVADAMSCFDVFSVNCYRDRVDRELAAVCLQMNMPAMIGEWHFGALDVGLPATGIGRVATQADRGKAFRIYTEDAAAQPWCVGAHYFTMYDQSALGRFDGENYNIGFVDICHRPYSELAEAARQSHQLIYPIAAGQMQPYDDEPEYLPRLFY